MIQVPQQQDDHCCGLFVLKFIELWEGNDKRSSSLEVVMSFMSFSFIFLFHDTNLVAYTDLGTCRVV